MHVDNSSRLWREVGAKHLVEFLTNAREEQHDSAVYDTGYEFDPSSPDAVRFIVCIAMTKAIACADNYREKETLTYDMPQDGSVVPVSEDLQNMRLRLRMFAEPRAKREEEAKFTYIPNYEAYVEAVTTAIQNRDIPYDDMTPEEKAADEERKAQIKKEANRFLILDYLKLGAVIAFVLIAIISFLSRCSAKY